MVGRVVIVGFGLVVSGGVAMLGGPGMVQCVLW